MFIKILKNLNTHTVVGGGRGAKNSRIAILLGLVNSEVEIATVLRNVCRYLAPEKA